MPVTIKMFGEKAQPLYGLFKKFTWTEECMTALELLKECLSKASILLSLEWDKESHIHTNAYAFAVGAELTHLGKEPLNSQ